MTAANAKTYPRFARIPTAAESEECRYILELLAQDSVPRSPEDIATEFQSRLGLPVRKRIVADYLRKGGWTYARQRQSDGTNRRVWLPPRLK